MSKFTKRILMFCVITFILGGVLFAVGMHMGEQTGQNPWVKENFLGNASISVDGARIHVGPSEESVEVKKELPAFENIHTKVECGNVQIVKGTAFRITCTYPEKEMPKFEVINGTLEVDQNCKDNHKGNATHSIVITVPLKEQLQDVTLENVVGNLSIADINAYSCKTTLTTGNIDIQDAQLERCVLTVSTGNICISTLISELCGVSTSTGDITITDSDVKEYALVNGVGNTTLELNKVTYDYTIDADTNVGNVIVNGEKKKDGYEKDGDENYRIKIGKDVGNISITTK